VKARAAVTPIVIIALATGAVAYAYLVDRGKVSDSERTTRRRDVFPSFRVEDVRRIELVHGAEKLVLEREPGGASSWAMTSPRAEHADGAAVDALLRELELATWVRRVSDDGTSAASPRATGTIDLGSLEYRFALGAEAAKPEGAAYLRLEGEGTFVVGRSVAVQLLRGADAYREKTLVPYGGKDVATIALRSGGGPAVTLERHGATYRLSGGLRASRAATDRMLMALADLRAEAFLDDARADAATSGAVLGVSVKSQDPQRPPIELRIGEACPGMAEDVVVVRTSPSRISACASKGIVEALTPQPEALVDESPFFARADEMEELRLEAVEGDAPRVDVARRGSSWHERAPEDRELSSEEAISASTLAQALAAARGTDARLPAPNQAFAPFARASVVRTGGEVREMVELSRPAADGTAILRRADDGALLRLSSAAARRLLPHAVALRPRPVWSAPFDAASVVSIDDTCGPSAQRLELRGDGTWVMLAPVGFTADAVSAADVASAIAHAKADAWISEVDDGSFGLRGASACTVRVSVSSPAGGARRQVGISFGDEGESGVYARTLEDPAVFVAPTVLRTLLTHPAIDRSGLRIDPAGVSSVVLDRGSARVSLTRRGTDLVRAGGPADAAPDDAMGRALQGLYALAALHTGPASKGEGMDRPTLALEATTSANAHRRITLGSEAQIDGAQAYYARVTGIDATFAVPAAPVRTILDSW
jgi:hypothetical protein